MAEIVEAVSLEQLKHGLSLVMLLLHMWFGVTLPFLHSILCRGFRIVHGLGLHPEEGNEFVHIWHFGRACS